MKTFSMTSLVLAGCTLLGACEYTPEAQMGTTPVYSPAPAPAAGVPARAPVTPAKPVAPPTSTAPAPPAAPATNYFSDGGENGDDRGGGGGGGGGWS